MTRRRSAVRERFLAGRWRCQLTGVGLHPPARPGPGPLHFEKSVVTRNRPSF